MLSYNVVGSTTGGQCRDAGVRVFLLGHIANTPISQILSSSLDSRQRQRQPNRPNDHTRTQD